MANDQNAGTPTTQNPDGGGGGGVSTGPGDNGGASSQPGIGVDDSFKGSIQKAKQQQQYASKPQTKPQSGGPSSGRHRATNPYGSVVGKIGSVDDGFPGESTDTIGGGKTDIIPRPILEQLEHRTYTFRALDDWPVPLIYGKAKVGAAAVYGPIVAPRGDGAAVVMYWICWGQINAISNILVDGKPLSTYRMVQGTDYNVYLGTSSQGVDPIMLAAEPSKYSGKNWRDLYGITGANIAYVVCKFPKPDPGQPAPDLLQFTCEVEGKLVRDPRSDATLVTRYFRENPPLCLADYFTSAHYGGAVPDAQMDWATSITASANACDATISDGVTKRFVIGGVITKRPFEDNVELIRQTAQIMRPVYNNGLYQINMDLAQSDSGIALAEDNILVNGSTPLTVRGSAQVYDRTVVKYVDVANGYKDNSVQSQASCNPADANYVEKRYEIPLITAGDQAQRIANYLQKRSQKDKSGTVRTNAIGTRILPGMRITVTWTPWGWTTPHDCIVTNVKPVGSAWDVSIEEYDANVYDDTKLTVTVGAMAVTASQYDPALISPGIVGVIGAGNIYVGSPAGGRALIGPSTQLTADLTTAATTIEVKHNTLASGDRVYLEVQRGGVVQIEYLAVTSGPSASGSFYSYSVTRNLDGSGANAWSVGDAVFNTRQSGAGFIDLYSARGLKSSSEVGPSIVGNIRNSGTYNDWTPRWAVGNLNGLYGYATDIYGAAFGVPTAAWLKIDPTNGIRIGHNATTKVQIDASGNASFAGSVTADSGTIGGWTISASALTAPSGAEIKGGQTAFDTGTGFWLGNAGGTPKFSIGVGGGGNGLTWDGTNLQVISGNVSIQSNTINLGTASLTASGGGIAITAGVGNIACGEVHAGGQIVTTVAGVAVLASVGAISAKTYFDVNGTQVVGARGAAVADATNATDVITQLNLWLARARAHGLIS